jgi:oligoribonuclease
MEFAVIITDKYLVEIERANWVIHHSDAVCASLSDWHQRQFRRVEEGGNGLFTDVKKSQLTRAQVEAKALELIKRHCPERQCPIGGSSPHCDRDAMKKTMPHIYKYLSHRLVDVTSLHELCQRWSPGALKEFPKPPEQGRAHRAMTDIERSIEMLRWYRKHFLVPEVDIPEPGEALRS